MGGKSNSVGCVDLLRGKRHIMSSLSTNGRGVAERIACADGWFVWRGDGGEGEKGLNRKCVFTFHCNFMVILVFLIHVFC